MKKHKKEHQLILDRVMEYVVLIDIPSKTEKDKIESYLHIALHGAVRYGDSEDAFENLCDLVQDYYNWEDREQTEGAIDMLIDRVGVLAYRKQKERETLH